jgi:Fibronectin type III domain
VTLTVPAILNVSNLNSGQLAVKISIVPGATGYEFRIVAGTGGAMSSQYFSSTRNIVLTGLTPGQTYGLQVRARAGNNAASDWSEAVTHMST